MSRIKIEAVKAWATYYGDGSLIACGSMSNDGTPGRFVRERDWRNVRKLAELGAICGHRNGCKGNGPFCIACDLAAKVGITKPALRPKAKP